MGFESFFFEESQLGKPGPEHEYRKQVLADGKNTLAIRVLPGHVFTTEVAADTELTVIALTHGGGEPASECGESYTKDLVCKRLRGHDGSHYAEHRKAMVVWLDDPDDDNWDW